MGEVQVFMNSGVIWKDCNFQRAPEVCSVSGRILESPSPRGLRIRASHYLLPHRHFNHWPAGGVDGRLAELSTDRYVPPVIAVINRIVMSGDNRNFMKGFLTLGFNVPQPISPDWYTNNAAFATASWHSCLGLPAIHPFGECPQAWTSKRSGCEEFQRSCLIMSKTDLFYIYNNCLGLVFPWHLQYGAAVSFQTHLVEGKDTARLPSTPPYSAHPR